MNTEKLLEPVTLRQLATEMGISINNLRTMQAKNIIHPLMALGRNPYYFDRRPTLEQIRDFEVRSLTTESVKSQGHVPKHRKTPVKGKKREELWAK